MSNEPIDVLTVMYAGSLVLASHGANKSADAINEARAAVAELMERERQQREVLAKLCDTYIANQHAIGLHDFVKCVTPKGPRLADSETGILWLEAYRLARCKGESS